MLSLGCMLWRVRIKRGWNVAKAHLRRVRETRWSVLPICTVPTLWSGLGDRPGTQPNAYSMSCTNLKSDPLVLTKMLGTRSVDSLPHFGTNVVCFGIMSCSLSELWLFKIYDVYNVYNNYGFYFCNANVLYWNLIMSKEVRPFVMAFA